MNRKYYVTMTDKFLSGWGGADGKIFKVVYECDSLEVAEIVAQNARARGDQKNINIVNKKPVYSSKTHRTEYKDSSNGERWYVKGAF